MEKLCFTLAEMLPSFVTVLVFFTGRPPLKGQGCDISDGRIEKQGKRSVDRIFLSTIHCSLFEVYGLQSAKQKINLVLSASVIDYELTTVYRERKNGNALYYLFFSVI